MGMGDEIMVSSIAKRMAAMTNKKVTIIDRDGKQRWNEMWEGLDYITKPGEAGGIIYVNGPAARHYYQPMKPGETRTKWMPWDIAPGEIVLTDEERAWARDFMQPFYLVETRFKPEGGGGSNKNWGEDNWQLVFEKLHDQPFIRVPDCPTFRHACALLERSAGFIGHEGGLHHAAAALGKKAVVIFGGYISSAITGYPGHINLSVGDGCGSVFPCGHCKEAMASITVDSVVQAIKDMMSIP